jgi:hypothetical protein
MAGEDVVLEIAAREDVGEGMADQFGHALLALRRTGGLFEAFGHGRLRD